MSGPGIDFRGDSILEGPRSMAQMGEFSDRDDRMQRNTARQDQQDPKITFMSYYVHARAKHRLGFSNKCITGWKHDRD